MNRVIILAVKALLILALSACAANSTPPVPLSQKLQDKGYRLGDEVKRISNFRLNGWNELDDRHVIMTSGVSDRYLLSLRSTCINLTGANTIAYTTTVGSLTVSDSLLVRDQFRAPERCPIQFIHKLESIR